MYLYFTWLKALSTNKSKLPPNFELSLTVTLLCLERVLIRRDIRRIVDIKIGFDAETQLLG